MNLSFKGTLFQVQTQGCEEREREREREREIVFTELQSTPSLHQNTLEEINEGLPTKLFGKPKKYTR